MTIEEVEMRSALERMASAAKSIEAYVNRGIRAAVEAETKRCEQIAREWWPDKETEWGLAINEREHAKEPYMDPDTREALAVAADGIANAIARKQDATDGTTPENASAK